MKNRNIILVTLALLSLVSCGLKNEAPVVPVNTNTGNEVANDVVDVPMPVISQEFKENRIGGLIEELKGKEKDLFSEYLEAKVSGDKQKEYALLEDIRTLEAEKRRELETAIKNGDEEEAKEIRKSMSIFSEIE